MTRQHDEKRKTRRVNLGGRGPHLSLDRRTSPRLPAVDDRVWAGWWVDDEEFTTTAARLENISRGGAKVRTAIEPDVSQDIWVRLAEWLGCESVKATVLEVVPAPDGGFWVRMAFSEPCPDDFFELATQGCCDHELYDSVVFA
jgi:hypothetical protein